MDTRAKDTIGRLKAKVFPQIQKYKLPFLLLCFGLILVGIPRTQKNENTITESEANFSLEKTTQQMEAILKQIDGVGDLSLMLTLKTGTNTDYLQDIRTTNQNETETKETSTVFQSGGSNVKTPITCMQTYPQYLGALVICSGADRASIRLAVKEAVSSLTGLGSDKISVIKMKE